MLPRLKPALQAQVEEGEGWHRFRFGGSIDGEATGAGAERLDVGWDGCRFCCPQWGDILMSWNRLR